MTATIGAVVGFPLLAVLLWQQRADTVALVILGAVSFWWCGGVIAAGLRGYFGWRVYWWPHTDRELTMPWLVLVFVWWLPACFFLAYLLIYAASVQLTGAPPSWLPWQ